MINKKSTYNDVAIKLFEHDGHNAEECFANFLKYNDNVPVYGLSNQILIGYSSFGLNKYCNGCEKQKNMYLPPPHYKSELKYSAHTSEVKRWIYSLKLKHIKQKLILDSTVGCEQDQEIIFIQNIIFKLCQKYGFSFEFMRTYIDYYEIFIEQMIICICFYEYISISIYLNDEKLKFFHLDKNKKLNIEQLLNYLFYTLNT